MNPFAAVESWCANVVERGFARVFGGALEPAQIARKLAAAIEGFPPEDAGGASEYRVRLSMRDFGRLEEERTLLERQWTKMAVALRTRSAAPGPEPAVRIVADEALADGTVAIDVVRTQSRQPQAWSLRIERGVARGKAYELPPSGASEALVLGRDAACDLVIADPRVSRKHVRLSRGRSGVAFEDLGSTNGTLLNGSLVVRGELLIGDRLQIGDTTLIVEARRPS